MRKRGASLAERIAYSATDGAFFVICWHVVTLFAKVRTPFGVHKRPYSEGDFLAYLEVMIWMTLALFAMSVVLHRFAGGSLGKLALGFRTRSIDGRMAGQRQVILRAAVLFGFAILILAPGPVAYYILGLDPAEASWPLLGGSAVLWLILAVFSFGKSGRTMLERWLGLETVWVAGKRA